jgi:hypothetical protein
VLLLLDQGRLLPATDYVNAQRLRRVMQKEFSRLWDRVDLIFRDSISHRFSSLSCLRLG